MTQKVKHISPGDVVMLLPMTVVALLRADLADGRGVLVKSKNFMKELAPGWVLPHIRNMIDEPDRGTIRWGDIAAYAGSKRVSTKPHNAGYLSRKRSRRRGINKARVMRHVFQFGSRRVIGTPEEFINVDHVPDAVHEFFRGSRDE